MSAPAAPAAPSESTTTPEPARRSNWSDYLRTISTGTFGVTVLAFVLALMIGSLLIIVTNEEVAAAASYFFSRPVDLFAAAWNAVVEAYSAMFRGAVYNYEATTFARAIRPLTETLTVATPLIIAALGVSVAFRAGLFNIGAQGQIILGATIGGYIGFHFELAPGIHLLLALIGAVVGGAVWAMIAGSLKAYTGAHEVIVTIMLNYVAFYLLAYLLTTAMFTREGSNQPKSPGIKESAQLPLILGEQFRLHAGFLIAIVASVFVWWLMTRSSWGFQFRAVGSNLHAARTAGMSVNRTYVAVMVVSGSLAGLAGGVHILGTEHALTGGIAGSLGFDAITVALLGRSKPSGIFAAGLLYAGLNVGGRTMESVTGTSINLVLIIQALVVLFIAAPPLVRAVFRLPESRAALVKGAL